MNGENTIYAKDIFTRRSPASVTKIMTALVTLKYGNLDDLVTVTDIVTDIEYGSSVCDIKEGDILSLRQLLYGMMVASGNDAAMMIAQYIGGSVEGFVQMMNDEAAAIGATSTHFMNPHGLTDPEHYTTVYDIYLIMNEALKYDTFQDIISRKNYYAEYSRTDGTSTAVTWESTNHYFTNEAEAPDDVVVYGGKTGTTDDAGACLALMAKDLYGNPYLSIILHSDSKDTLYQEMNELLSLINQEAA
jgi:D-alanyl-D-alanine carboxypeptidase